MLDFPFLRLIPLCSLLLSIFVMSRFITFVRLRWLTVLALLAVPALSMTVLAGPLQDYFVPGQKVEAQIAETLQADGRAVEKIVKDYEAIVLFYEARHFKPIWVNSYGPLERGREFMDILGASWTHGLNPYSYHYAEIDALLNQNDPQKLADLELLMTDAYVRLGQDLSGIRVDPKSLNSAKHFWKQPYTAPSLLKNLGDADKIEPLVEAIAPQGQTYKRLQEELIRLSREPAEDYESILPIKLEQNFLHPYQRSSAVPKLRTRLGISGAPADPTVYDDRTAAAVIRFQKENGLKADGIVGGQTLEILNGTREKKIEQVVANLERLRWVDEKKPDKFVVVNIPSATLWAVENGRVAFDMPVIVGREKRPTNIFIANITGVRFNPNWTVPPTIKKDDILPKLRTDPTYLSHKGLELIYGSGAEAVTVDPESIDWANMTISDLRGYRMVQKPGANNPLGRVRVLMPNDFNIYLHDTNEPSKFSRAGRAESSGCVRMSEPEKMASFIMKERQGWTDAQMEGYFADGKMRDIGIPKTIPVYMLYYTVWINEDGRVVYGNDLYDYDNKLIKMLRNIDGIFIPVDNNELKSG